MGAAHSCDAADEESSSAADEAHSSVADVAHLYAADEAHWYAVGVAHEVDASHCDLDAACGGARHGCRC